MPPLVQREQVQGIFDVKSQTTSPWIQPKKQHGFFRSSSQKGRNCRKPESQPGQFGETESHCGETEPVRLEILKTENVTSISKNSTDIVKIDNKSKQKQSRRKEKYNKQLSLKFLGNNVNSLVSKLVSFENVLNVEKPSAFFLQETKLG